MSQRRAAITALGTLRARAGRDATHDLAKIVDTSDEWIRTRTGIASATTSSPARRPASSRPRRRASALRRRGIDAYELDLIIVATVTPDMLFPATACLVQDKIGASRAWAFDVSAACSGFTYALTIGAQFVETGRAHEGDGDRRRRDDRDPRLQGPHHLRAVRRRRRRGAPRAARGRHRDPGLPARSGRLGRLLP